MGILQLKWPLIRTVAFESTKIIFFRIVRYIYSMRGKKGEKRLNGSLRSTLRNNWIKIIEYRNVVKSTRRHVEKIGRNVFISNPPLNWIRGSGGSIFSVNFDSCSREKIWSFLFVDACSGYPWKKYEKKKKLGTRCITEFERVEKGKKYYVKIFAREEYEWQYPRCDFELHREPAITSAQLTALAHSVI